MTCVSHVSMVQDHTMLHLAAFADDEAAVQMLLGAGAEVNTIFSYVNRNYVSTAEPPLKDHMTGSSPS